MKLTKTEAISLAVITVANLFFQDHNWNLFGILGTYFGAFLLPLLIRGLVWFFNKDVGYDGVFMGAAVIAVLSAFGNTVA